MTVYYTVISMFLRNNVGIIFCRWHFYGSCVYSGYASRENNPEMQIPCSYYLISSLFVLRNNSRSNRCSYFHKNSRRIMSSQKRLQDFFAGGGGGGGSSKKAKKDGSSDDQQPAAAVAAKSKRLETYNGDNNKDTTWKVTDCGTLLYYLPPLTTTSGSNKIAGFDIDGTIITTKSGKKFPTNNRTDWQIGFGTLSYASSLSLVKNKLEKLQTEDNYRIVFFSNQEGIRKGKIKQGDWTHKIDAVIQKLGLKNITVLASLSGEGGNDYRKPHTGMWRFLVEEATKTKQQLNDNCDDDDNNDNNSMIPDPSQSLFVGDAAGRPKEGQTHPKKDFSASDYKFALNVSPTPLKFYTPEEFFAGAKQKIHCDRSLAVLGFQPKVHWKDYWEQYQKQQKQEGEKKETATVAKTEQHTELEAKLLRSSSQQEVILLVGCPASGKSSLCRRIFGATTATTNTAALPPVAKKKEDDDDNRRHYVRINQDTLQTSSKCIQCMNDALEKGYSVIIDNTNRDTKTRRLFVTEAKKKHDNVAIRCIWITTTKEEAFHLNRYRGLVGSNDDDYRRLPDVVLHSYFKNMQPPDKDKEGFSVVQIPFVPGPFSSTEKANAFFQYMS